MPPLDYKQNSFQGGINQLFDSTKIPEMGDSYYLGVNIRNREDVLQPIQSPLNLANTFPAGNLQGIYGAGTVLVLFIDGKPFYRDVSGGTNFIALSNPVAMDEDTPYIYAEFIPASTVGYARLKIPGQQNVQFDFEQELPFVSSQQGLIYQDGINQGALLLDNSVETQRLNTYAEWNTTNREYVPVMKQMLYYGGILFGVSADGKEFYHSVSGRPLDYIVAVNDEGDKVSDVEKEGGASAVSKRVDFNIITAIHTTPVDSTFVISTDNKIFLTQLDNSNPYFSEPAIEPFVAAAVGAVNHFCFVDLGGDTAFITQHGIDSINSAAILKQESRNSPVSGVISRLFQAGPVKFISQDFPCAFQFGADFAMFAVNTIYGRVVLIYDRTTQKFISMDKYSGVGQIKMFAQVLVEGQRRLFFITTDNQLYEAFAGEGVETAEVTIGEWCSNDPKISQKPVFLHLVFTECEEEGTVEMIPYINRQRQTSKIETLLKKIDPPIYPIATPFPSSEQDSTQIVSFNLTGTIKAGWKIGINIKWNVKAKLTHINLISESQTFDINQQSKGRRFTALSV